MLRFDKHIVNRSASWAVLVYATTVLVLVLPATDIYLNGLASSTTVARLAGYSGSLGLCSMFLGVALWDVMRTDGVRMLSIYSSVGYIIIPFGLTVVLALAFQLDPTAYRGQYGGSTLLIFWPFINLLIMLFAVSIAAIPAVVRHFRYIFILSLTVLTFGVLWDFFSPGDLSVVPGRAAGFASNPNITASLLLTMLIVSVDWKKPSFSNVAIWLVAGAAILPTFSREGLLLYVFTLGAYVVLTVRTRAKALLHALLLYGVLAILFASFFGSGSISLTHVLGSDTALSSYEAQERLKDYEALLGGDFTSILEDDRVEVGNEFMSIIAQSPILGHGTAFSLGYPGGQGPHNLYLRQWTDNGVLGLMLLLVFLFASFLHFAKYKDVRGMIFVAVFCLLGFFSHDLLEQRPFLVMFGFLGALAYVERLEPLLSRSSLPRP